jgi:twitching motility protein PilT
MINLHQLLKILVDGNGSDLHITTHSPPQMRVDGQLLAMDFPPLNQVETKQLCFSVLTDAQKHKFEEENELDLSFGVKGLSRFRGNLFIQRGAVAGVFRVIPYKILNFDELGLPPVVSQLAARPRGLILVTGPTGSGKSTTLASIVDYININRKEHIITIEDPIEYIHQHKGCLINQREVGADTKGFKNALRYVLRQDPDVVLVGELRDLETIEAALTLAETGHLCLATLHTNSCAQTINRIVDVFPPYQQTQIRTQLSFVLEGVISQTLLPLAGSKGRALALEIMVPNAAIRNLIREDKVHQIYSQMQIGQENSGMQTMNQALYILLQRRKISLEDALGRSQDPDELKLMISNPASAAMQRRAQRN